MLSYAASCPASRMLRLDCLREPLMLRHRQTRVSRNVAQKSRTCTASFLWTDEHQATRSRTSTWQESTRSQQRLWLGGANLLHTLAVDLGLDSDHRSPCAATSCSVLVCLPSSRGAASSSSTPAFHLQSDMAAPRVTPVQTFCSLLQIVGYYSPT